jgi:hypothetical protein
VFFAAVAMVWAVMGMSMKHKVSECV